MDEQKNGLEVSKGKTTCACGAGCNCSCGHGYVHCVIKWVMVVIILVVVFAMGMKAGEFRDELRGAFGGYDHGYSTWQNRGNEGMTVPPVAQPMPAQISTSTSGSANQ